MREGKEGRKKLEKGENLYVNEMDGKERERMKVGRFLDRRKRGKSPIVLCRGFVPYI